MWRNNIIGKKINYFARQEGSLPRYIACGLPRFNVLSHTMTPILMKMVRV